KNEQYFYNIYQSYTASQYHFSSTSGFFSSTIYILLFTCLYFFIIPQSEAMWWGTLGSVRPYPNFRPERDVTVLHTALEKKDVSTIVRLLTNRSNAQRRSLAQVYKNFSQKELDASLKKVLSGDLQSLILELMMIPEQFEAHRLRKAMEGAGTDEETLLEMLCTRMPQQLSDIRAAYSQEYKRDLEKDLISETSGDFSKLIVALLKVRSSLSEELKNKKPAADIWIKLLTTRNPDHLRTGELQVFVYVFLSPVVQGVMVAHSEEDLLRVRVAYLQSTGTSLYTALQHDFFSYVAEMGFHSFHLKSLVYLFILLPIAHEFLKVKQNKQLL
uniref:Annexin n=1 Tax=Sinocyclocheilus rhinocerous TaxID=307959 RepID=A0A673K4U2_9TELE